MGDSEKSQLFGAKMRIQTWTWILTTDARSDHHWQAVKRLVKFVTAWFDVFLWQLFPNGMQRDFQNQLINQSSLASVGVSIMAPRRDNLVGSSEEFDASDSLQRTQDSLFQTLDCQDNLHIVRNESYRQHCSRM